MARNGRLEATRGGGRTVLAVGVDNLDTLEELFGDELGDEVVAALRRRLAAALPAGARLSATRHRRLLVGLGRLGARSAAALFGRLQRTAAGAIATSSGPVAVTLSAGCAVSGDAARARPDALERAALQALHAAMARGVGSFRMAGDDAALLDYRERLSEAARAAGAALGADGPGRLTVVFQPVVRSTGGRVIAFHECLARIQRPDGDLLSAADFMPAIERLGLAPLIDRQVLAIALDTLARHPAARLSVNIFPQTMQDAEWMAVFDRAVARDPGLAERLIVEVTETCSVLDPARTLAFMERLRAQGVAFALDDFGAGHSSLRYLREFRFDIVKLDGRFVRDIGPASDEAFFVETLARIARRFDMATVAEAVQGPSEARCLADLGVEFFQGFYFGSPSLVLEPTSSPMPGVAAQA